MKTEGIILAAGLSSRAGTNKLILEIDGIPIIERCILAMEDYCSKIIVVGGHRIDDIYKIIKKHPNIYLIYNQDYLSGMLSSVKSGIKFLEGDRFFIQPGDLPIIKKTTYEYMLRFNEDIIIPTHNSKSGHPALIKTHLTKEILSDHSINSLRNYIKKKDSTRLEVGDPGILLDVDTIEDYKMIRKLS